MKVIIVSLSSQYIHSSLAPWYLLASCKENCKAETEVKVIEGTVNENYQALFKRIADEKADVIAFSVYIWNVKTVLYLAEKLKCNNVKIILGGPEVSYCSDKILSENKFVDFIISGEGEEPFPTLLNAIYKGNDYKAIKGLSYRNNGEIIFGQPYVSHNIPVNPYGDEYFSSLNGRIAYIETSRGCPFFCAFCLSGRCGGVRFFPLERAYNDIIALANSNSKIIKFVDRTFNANRKRAYEIFEFIIENYGKSIPNNVCFHFEIGGDLLCEKDFELLKKVPKGAIQFEIGLQSFNRKTLNAINRKTNVKRLKENISQLIKLENIHIHIDLIAGLPHEDLKTFRESFNTAFKLNANMLQLGFLKLLNGAAMREEPEKFPLEFSSEAPYEVINTPWLTASNIKLLKACENALERFVNSGRFPLTNKLIFEVQKRNPFDTLAQLGMFTGLDSCSLNEYVNMIHWFFGRGCDENVLRDALICDIASSVKSTVLPSSLIVDDKRLSKFKKSLEANESTKKKTGVMRSTFLLYGEGCGAYVDYDKNENGKYIIKKIKFEL